MTGHHYVLRWNAAPSFVLRPGTCPRFCRFAVVLKDQSFNKGSSSTRRFICWLLWASPSAPKQALEGGHNFNVHFILCLVCGLFNQTCCTRRGVFSVRGEPSQPHSAIMRIWPLLGSSLGCCTRNLWLRSDGTRGSRNCHFIASLSPSKFLTSMC